MKTKRPQNALTHGLYARDTVLPWEDPDAFAAHRQAIRDELQPDGPLEEEAVRDIAELQWRKQRLAFGFLLAYYKKSPPAELMAVAKEGLTPLATYLAATTNQSGTITATGSQILDYIKTRMIGADNVAPPPKVVENAAPSVVEQAYDPAGMANHLKVEAMIDNRISKAISRLVGLKEYKIIYAREPMQTLSPAASPQLTPPVEPPAESPAPTSDTTTDQPTGWTVTSRRR